MAVRYPSMSALRALEAAASHLSYTRAAEDLFVTQSAISHQIKHIEELWGVELFSAQGADSDPDRSGPRYRADCQGLH